MLEREVRGAAHARDRHVIQRIKGEARAEA
jgi:hypothetical protein